MKLSKNVKRSRLAWDKISSHYWGQNKKIGRVNKYLKKRERREKISIAVIDLKLRANKKISLKESDQKSFDPVLMVQLQSFIENMKKSVDQFDKKPTTTSFLLKTRVWMVLATFFKQIEKQKKNLKQKNSQDNLPEINIGVNQKQTNISSTDYFGEIFSNFEHSSFPLDFENIKNFLDFSKPKFNLEKSKISLSYSSYTTSFPDYTFPFWNSNLENFKKKKTKKKNENIKTDLYPLFYNFTITEYGNFFGSKKKKGGGYQNKPDFFSVDLLWGEIF